MPGEKYEAKVRGIKFRAWDKENKMYVYFHIRLGNEVFLDPTIYDEELRLYTGLADKNDKEIYEGDIVKGDKGDIAVVEWEEGIDRDRYWATANGFGIVFDQSDAVHGCYEVIGNIYENPELLSRQVKGEEVKNTTE